VRLLDFGIAFLRDADFRLTRTLSVPGTPGYIAPEQLRGDHHELGPHTDIFALGAIAYEALTSGTRELRRLPET
ncbi:MAG: Protein kinase, partial [Myxococcaceae bacterium]|nr:Protein kinase [Myxococcaceae bacterium]